MARSRGRLVASVIPGPVASELLPSFRPVVERVERGRRLGAHTLLVGSAGSGKTSVLYHLDSSHPSAVYVPASDVTDLEGLVVRIVERVTGDTLRTAARDDLGLVAALVDRLSELPGTPWVLLDDAPVEILQLLFGAHRDLTAEAPATWLVTARPAGASVLLAGAAAGFFLDQRVLPDLSIEDAVPVIDLVIGRNPEHEPVRELLLTHLEGAVPPTPRQLQRLVTQAALLDSRDLEPALATWADRIDELPDSHRRVYRSLSGQPASASDGDLQRDTGLGRARLTTVLGDLEEADLATAVLDGRRKVYRPTTLEELRP